MSKLRERLSDKSLATDTAWAFAFELVSLAANLVSFGLLGRHLGAKAYGDYIGIFAVTAPFGALASSGTSLTLLQHGIREREDLQSVFRSCLSMSIFASIVSSSIAIPVAVHVVSSLSALTLMCFVLAEFLGSSMSVVAATTIQVGKGFGPAARARIVPIAIRIVLLIGLTAFGHLRLKTLGPAYLATSLVVGAGMLKYSSTKNGLTISLGRVRKAHLKDAVLYSVGISAMSIQNDGDKAVMTANNLGRDTGLYAAAYKIVQLGLVPIGSLIASSHQKFLEHDPNARNQHVRRTYRFTLIAIAYGLTFGAGMYVLAPFLTRLLGGDYKDATSTIRWLAPFVLARGVGTFAVNGLMGLGKNGARTLLLIGGASLSMVLYITLIPRHSWRGAVAATLISEATFTVCAWLCLLYYQAKHNQGLLVLDGLGSQQLVTEIHSESVL